jgi:ribosomal protein L27
MACKNTHQVASAGSKAYRQWLLTNPFQKVKAGTILVRNAKRLKLGDNIYRVKAGNIHSKVNGIVELKNGRISVIPE